MTILLLAARQALEALEWAEHLVETSEQSSQEARWAFDAALPALRTAITQAEAEIRPLYFVQHPDGSYSVADPQPTAIQEAEALKSQEPVVWQRIDPETQERIWDEDSFSSHPNDLDDCVPLYLAPQPAPKQEPDTAYDEAKRLAEWLFKTHYASEECYASGRIAWEVCDTTDGVISQIDNMVYPLVMPAPVQAKQLLENLDELSVGDSLFESWFSEYRPAHKGTKQQMRDAYAAGMGDPLVAPPQAQPDHFAGDGNMVQPLTFDQIEDIWTKHGLNECDCHGFARAIEQAHGIKVQP